MKQAFGLVRRPWGVFYLKHKITGVQTSLKTSDKHEAQRILQAHNESDSQPHFNLSLARVYLNGADPKLATRTWQEVMENIVAKKTDETRRRWDTAIKDKNFDCIRNLRVAETRPEHFDRALADCKVSTNVYLRRIHNHALGMEWLLKSVIPRLQWPRPVFKAKRAITAEEHAAIVAREQNTERRDFYELLWHTGASQTDGQGLILIEAFSRAVDKALGKPIDELKYSACLPVWGHNIADIFAKTVFKTTVALDPKGRFDARNFGRMFGLLLRAGVFLGKEAMPILKKDGLLDLSKTDEKKIEDAAGIEHLFPVASKKFNRPIRNENQLFSQGERYAEKWATDLLKSHVTLFLHLWNQSIEEQHTFLCGVAEGFVMFLDTGGQFTGDRGRTNLYINLLVNWREIAAMQNAEPAKSRRELQQWLIAEAKIPISNDEAWFDHLCDEIGLSMKGVGRPVKTDQ